MTNGEKIKEIFPDTKIITQYDNPFGDRFIVFTLNNEDMQVNIEWWNVEYKEPSNSEKPNRSVEEKCPCYHCEYFEIKGWSHCKIHEDAYGDSRCNDYRKANQGSNKVNQCLTKSEIPTGSTTKNETLVSLGVYNQVARERDIAIQQLHELGYEFGQKIEPTTKNDLGVDCIDRQATITFVCKNTEEILKDTMPLEVKLSDDYLYENIAKIMRNPKVLPSVTPIRPKGHWIMTSDYLTTAYGSVDYVKCSCCGEDSLEEGDYCPNCGAEMSEVEE